MYTLSSMNARRQEAEALTKHPVIQELQHLEPNLLTHMIAASGILSRITNGRYVLKGAKLATYGKEGSVWFIGDQAIKVIIGRVGYMKQTFKLVSFYYQIASDHHIGPPILELVPSPIKLTGTDLSVGFIIMKKCKTLSSKNMPENGWDQIDDKFTRLSQELYLMCTDLKPHNMLLDPDSNEIYITDYSASFCSQYRAGSQTHINLMRISFYIVATRRSTWRRKLSGTTMFINDEVNDTSSLVKYARNIAHYLQKNVMDVYRRLRHVVENIPYNEEVERSNVVELFWETPVNARMRW